MSLRDLFQKDPTLKKALTWGLVAGLLTAGYTLTLPNQYTSEILVLPGGNGGSSLSALASAAGMLGIGGLGKTDDAYYPDILTSRWLAEKLLDSTYQFTYKSWYFGAVQQRNQTLASFLKATTPQKRESALKQVGSWLTATSDLKTGVLHIKVEAPSPELAQAMTNRAADLLDEALKTRVQSSGSAKAAYAKARLARAREEEDRARQALVAYAEAHRNMDQSPDPAVRAQGQALMAEVSLRHQIATNVALGYEQAELESRNTVPVLNRLAGAYLPSIKSGPRRSTIVLFAALTIFLIIWLYDNKYIFLRTT